MVWLPDGETSFDDTFIRFNRIHHERDGRIDGQTDEQTDTASHLATVFTARCCN